MIWADIPLVTDGAAVDVAKQDGTQSMFWHLTEHEFEDYEEEMN